MGSSELQIQQQVSTSQQGGTQQLCCQQKNSDSQNNNSNSSNHSRLKDGKDCLSMKMIPNCVSQNLDGSEHAYSLSWKEFPTNFISFFK